MPENKNDKGYRRLLSERRNFLDLVKNHIAAPWADRIREDDLELIDKRFVTKDFRDREADVVYRAKVDGRDTVFYVLLELQSKVDFTMPFRLLVYMVELMRRLFAEAGPKARGRKGFRLPAVVPIVLYNGAGKWSCVRSFKEYLAGYELFAPNVIDFEYLMIDVNGPDEAKLTDMPTLMNLAMLVDRKGDADAVMRRLRSALRIVGRLTADEQVQLNGWIRDTMIKKANGNLRNEIIEEFFKKEGTSEMEYALGRALDEIERRSVRKGKLETAKSALARGFSVRDIADITGLDEETVASLRADAVIGR
jgi:predicted transposase/invertase (TIGR01784 family)